MSNAQPHPRQRGRLPVKRGRARCPRRPARLPEAAAARAKYPVERDRRHRAATATGVPATGPTRRAPTHPTAWAIARYAGAPHVRLKAARYSPPSTRETATPSPLSTSTTTTGATRVRHRGLPARPQEQLGRSSQPSPPSTVQDVPTLESAPPSEALAGLTRGSTSRRCGQLFSEGKPWTCTHAEQPRPGFGGSLHRRR